MTFSVRKYEARPATLEVKVGSRPAVRIAELHISNQQARDLARALERARRVFRANDSDLVDMLIASIIHECDEQGDSP